jgi:hypothetical protein
MPNAENCACYQTQGEDKYAAEWGNLLPTSGSSKYSNNNDYPQCNEIARRSSIFPDFPLASNGKQYAQQLESLRRRGGAGGAWQLFDPWTFSSGSSGFGCQDTSALVFTFFGSAGEQPVIPPPSESMSTATIVGIVVGVVVFLGIIITIAVVFYKKSVASAALSSTLATATNTPTKKKTGLVT